jgi:hypothetical protein
VYSVLIYNKKDTMLAEEGDFFVGVVEAFGVGDGLDYLMVFDEF